MSKLCLIYFFQSLYPLCGIFKSLFKKKKAFQSTCTCELFEIIFLYFELVN